MKKFSTVLIADDDPIARLIYERIIKLTLFSETVVCCESGQLTLELLMRSKNTVSMPELIFVDISTPEMNGWEFLEEFEKIKDDFIEVPVIYMMSSAIDSQDFKQAGNFLSVKGFISKPLTKEALDKIRHYT